MPDIHAFIIKKATDPDTAWRIEPVVGGQVNISGLTPGTKYRGRAAGPEMDLETLASTALSAPELIPGSPLPAISGSTLVGSTLTRAFTGEFSGNPTPQKQALWGEKKAGATEITVIPGQNGESFTAASANYSAWDEIFTGTRAYNSEGEVIVWSEAWTLTEQPTITAEPFTLTAGQPTTIRFNTSVETVTAAQGSTTLTATRVGTTDDWNITPITADPVIIGATKDGWKEYSATITPAGALPTIIKTDAKRLQFFNVNENTPDEPFTMTGPYAGTRPVDFAAMASGPVFHVNPSQSWTGEPGDPITFDEGFVLNFESAGPVIMSVDLYVDTTLKQGVGAADYVYTGNDAGKTITRRVVLEDNKGVRPPYITNGIAIPAAGIADGVTELGVFSGGVAAESSITNTAEIPLGGADAGKTIYVWLAAGAGISECKIVAGGVDYPGVVLETKAMATSANGRLALLQIPCPAGGTGTLHVTGTATTIRPRGRVQAVKNRTLVATLDTAFNFTAGTALAPSAGATLVGDTLIQTLLVAAANESGVISASLLPEIYDAPVTPTGPQLWVGKGTETAASENRTLSVTPSVTAEYACVIAVFRNA